MSYAQVAQHHKELNSQKEKQQKVIDKQINDHSTTTSGKAVSTVTNASAGSARIQVESRDSRGNLLF